MKRGNRDEKWKGEGYDYGIVSFDAHQIPTDGHWMQSFFPLCSYGGIVYYLGCLFIDGEVSLILP